MKLLDKFCKYYLSRQNKVAKVAEKKIQDKKLEEATEKLKALYEFVRFINEKCVRNRHERKTFWRNVSEGHPLVEETIVNVLRRMGVTEESIKAITDAKVKAQEQREAQEMARKNQIEEAKKKMAKDSAIGCPTDCSADCSKCANKPVASETKKIEEEKKN
jgi:hypothetical protein